MQSSISSSCRKVSVRIQPATRIPLLSKEKSITWSSLGVVCLLTAAMLPLACFAAQKPAAPPSASAKSGVALDRTIPLYFEENQGQAGSEAHFMARGAGYTALLTGREAVLQYRRDGRDAKNGKDAREATVRMSLAGSQSLSQPSGSRRLEGVVNYLIGNDPSKWLTHIPTYAQVDYNTVYPGVDLVYRGTGAELEFDFHVKPGADPRQIRMSYSGASQMYIDSDGNLVLQTSAGAAKMLKPIVYQQTGTQRTLIAGSYQLLGHDQVGFHLGAYDHTQPLVIDPIAGALVSVKYSTYLGSGSGNDTFRSIAVDSAGEVFLCGNTSSTSFPTSSTAFSKTFPSGVGTVGFVTALNATGTGIKYSTYIAGSTSTASNNGTLNGVAVDSTGFAFVAGSTDDGAFPTTKAFQAGLVALTSGVPSNEDHQDGIVFELSQDGSSLVYSTYLGGPDPFNEGDAIAVDSSDNAYVTGRLQVYPSGSPHGAGFPTTSGVVWPAFNQSDFGAGFDDAFAVKISPPASGNAARSYSMVIGSAGGSQISANAIAVDSSGDAYITGFAGGDITNHGGTVTTNLNMTNVSRSVGQEVVNGYVVELNSTGSTAVYVAYLGGNAPSGTFSPDTEPAGIAVDSSGQAYVTGTTEATNFQTTSSAYQKSPSLAGVNVTLGGNTFEQADGFITVISPGATSGFVYSTYLNGSTLSSAANTADEDGTPNMSGIAVSGVNQFTVTGRADTTDYPVSATAAPGTPVLTSFPSGADYAVFVTQFSGGTLAYSYFLGGGSEQAPNGIAANGQDLYVAFPEFTASLSTSGAYDGTVTANGKELIVGLHDVDVSTSVSVSAASVSASSSAQTVAMNSTVSASSATVSAGTVTYTVTNSSAVQIGTSVTSGTVASGTTPSVNYTLPAGTPIGTYTITAAYSGSAGFLSALAINTLTVSAIAPSTAVVNSVSSPFGSTTGITVTSTESGAAGVVTGGVVTLGTAGSVGGSFSPTTCSLNSSGNCNSTYTPSGTLNVGTYNNDITASFAANNNYTLATSVSPLTITSIAPTVSTVSAVTSPFGVTTGITVTATESGTGGVVTGGVVTFGTAGSVGGSFSPTTCSLSSGGTCTTTYTPSGTLNVGTYATDITASFAANNNYSLATGSSTLTITSIAPTTHSVSAVSSPFGSTTGITVTATESGTGGVVTGGVVTFGTAGSVGGSFSPTTCTLIAAGTCTTTYTPSGTLNVGTYATDITASFAANNNYSLATGSSTLTITAIAPTVKTVSTVTTPFGTTAGITVTATESGTGGAVTGGIVTFGLAGTATGSFSPTTCTLPVGGSCTTTYTPTGTLPASTYTNDITAAFGAVGNYAAANATSTLTITTIAPTVATVSAVTTTFSTTTGITVTATESGTGGVVTGGIVTFGTTGTATGSFSPPTCTLTVGGTCTTSYIPTGTLPVAVYPNDITASFATVGNYSAASATSTLTINLVPPTVSTVSAVATPFGAATGITVTATESGTGGVVTGGVVTFGLAGTATGSFSPTTCTLTVGGTCTTTYTPTGVLVAGVYTNDITVSFTAVGNYTAASGASTLTIGKATTTVALLQTAPVTIGSIGTGVPSAFTATVTDSSGGSTGTPTGSVNFLDGSTLLNPSPIALTGGVASIAGVLFSTVATHPITVVYLGDTNFIGSTSATLNESVVIPTFSVAANPNILTIARGNSGIATLTFTPVGNYQGSVTLNCTGLPVFASCQFLPATIVFTGNNAVQTMQLTVFTLNAHDIAGGNAHEQSLLWFPAAGMLAALIAIRRRKFARTLRPLLMPAIAALAMTALTGCSGASFVTPTGSNPVVISAAAIGASGTSSSSTTQTANITIIITQ